MSSGPHDKPKLANKCPLVAMYLFITRIKTNYFATGVEHANIQKSCNLTGCLKKNVNTHNSRDFTGCLETSKETQYIL